MDNYEKLLRAFIEAQGYEIQEEVKTEYILVKGYPGGFFSLGVPDVTHKKTTTDYKVTKNGKDNRLMSGASKTTVNRLEVSVQANKDLMDKNRKLQQLLTLHLKVNGLNYTQIAKELSVTPTVVKNYFRKVDRLLQREVRNEKI